MQGLHYRRRNAKLADQFYMGPATTAAYPFLHREILFIKEFSSKGAGKEFLGYYAGVQANVLGEKRRVFISKSF